MMTNRWRRGSARPPPADPFNRISTISAGATSPVNFVPTARPANAPAPAQRNRCRRRRRRAIDGQQTHERAQNRGDEDAVEEDQARLEQHRVVEDQREPAEQRRGRRRAQLPEQDQKQRRDRDARDRRDEPEKKDRLIRVRLADLLEGERAVVAAELRAEREEQLAVRGMNVEHALAGAAVGRDGLAPMHFVEHDLARVRQADEVDERAERNDENEQPGGHSA